MELQFISGNKLPMVHQNTIAECGLACLAMIAGYYGYETDISTIRSRFATSTRGMNMLDLQSIADRLGFSGRGIRAPISALKKFQLPAVLHWNESHFVVLKSVHSKHIVIHDPEAGVVKVTLEELPKFWKGIAMEFTPTPAFRKGKNKQEISPLALFEGIPGMRSALLQILMVALCLEVFVNLVPLYMQWVVDDVLTSGDLDLLTILFIGYVFIFSFQSMTSYLRSWVTLRFGFSVNSAIQTKVFNHLLKLPCNYFEQRHVGDIVSRFHGLHSIQQALTTNFVEAFIDGLMSIFVCIIIFAYSPKLAAVAVLFTAMYGLLRWLRYRPFKDAMQQQLICQAELDSHFLETIQGVRGIKLFNKHLVRRTQWLRLLFKTYNNNIKLAILNMKYGEIAGFAGSAERGIILYIGAHEVVAGSMSIGFLLAFIAYKDQFMHRTNSLIEKAISLAMVKLEVDRLWDIVGTEKEEEPELPYLLNAHIQSDLTIKDIGFRYSQYDQWVLKNFHAEIKAGEHVAIIGRSGAGKSTLAKIILGVLKPEEGKILIGGIPINTLGSSARTYMTSVMQDDELYAGTILENISFFDDQPNMYLVEQCAKLAEIHHEIRDMKMGYNTLVGDMGSSLSGGQKQRILIARALYAKPAIILFDESTSNLDVELEKKIAANIKNLHITRVSIAHRPETIKSADRIINLDEK